MCRFLDFVETMAYYNGTVSDMDTHLDPSTKHNMHLARDI